ncbi:hypothetical protein LUZ60_000186 [Juncus effusus]|nr:hypothetical protein LUZ60_000186 [Juncus effusus]
MAMGTPMQGSWTTGLFGCCEDCSSCCLTLWCPCVAFGRIAHTVDKGLTSRCGAGTLCCVLALFVGFHWIYTCVYRHKFRMNYNLPETPCCDCCVEYFCECCSLSQMYRELQNRGFDMSKGYNQNTERIGSAGMQMQPPTMQGSMIR